MQSLFTNNPYRIVGLLVGATAREQNRQIRRLKQYIYAEQVVEDDFSFPVLGKLERTVADVEQADAQLSIDRDKLIAALFWFYNGNAITDEPAFEALKESNVQRATEIWSKLTNTEEVTQRNSSAFQNLSTLLLCTCINGKTAVNERQFEEGLILKLKFLESDFVKNFKSTITDETFKTTKKDVQISFLDALQLETENQGEIFLIKLLEILSKQNFTAKEEFMKLLVQKPIEQIEKKIEEVRKDQKANPAKAGDYGNELYKSTKPFLSSIIDVLGKSDNRIISVSDRLANEILQCSINLFNHFHETDTEVGEIALDLNKKAKSLALGSLVKERINESTPIVERYISERPEREKQKLIRGDLQFITSKLERFQNLSDTVANAKDLVDSCKLRLVNIKNALGSFDDFYLKISSAIVSNAQGMLVTAVNEAQEGFKKHQTLSELGTPNFFINSQGKMQFRQTQLVSLSELSNIVNSAYDVTTSMLSMDMASDLKQSFQKNREALGSIRSQINSVTNRATTQSTTSTSSGSSGCYIATMVYGDYDHPQVMLLRQFRDDVLDKSSFGKWFIKTYYRYSPKLVEKLKNKKTVNYIIRKVLNQLIKLIK